MKWNIESNKMEPKLSNYLSRAASIDTSGFDKKIRVGFLGAFTLNGLPETVQVKCAEKKIECITYLAGYDQYQQEILNPESQLYKFVPNITFLILDTKNILGNLFYFPYSLPLSKRKEFIEKKFDELTNLIHTFIDRTQSKIIVTNFCIPSYSPYGIYETKMEYGIKEMIMDLNRRLEQMIQNEPSAFVYDFNSFVTRHGEENVLNYKQYFFGDIRIAFDFIPYLAGDFMAYIKASVGINLKCIVLDLDNTLWGGVVGEEGFDGIHLGPTPPGNSFVEFQKHLLALHNRGIILAINSKNNPDDAFEVIRNHPYMILREDNFSAIKINWNDKVANMKEIAEDLNIGLNSIAFFDDDPVNREYIKANIPEVLTVDLPTDSSYYASTLLKMNDFDVLKITEEDTKRGVMYLQEKKRKDFEKTASNLDEFLKQLDIKLKIKKSDEFTIPRISQLTLKTNQFNLTTRRYQEEDIRKLSQNKSMLVGCAQVEDKFGDNGITGAFIVNKDNPIEWTIDTFLLSCRIMGRGIEQGILGYILEQAKAAGVNKVKGQYIPTKKNKPCEEFLAENGFVQEGDYWVYEMDKPIKIPPYLKVIEENV